MKTRELIEKLQQADPDSDVFFKMDTGCCGDYEDMQPYDASVDEYQEKKDPKPTRWVTIRLEALPGYFSCIQAGGTVRRHNEYWEYFHKPQYKHISPVPEPHEDKKKSCAECEKLQAALKESTERECKCWVNHNPGPSEPG